ncbi:response regulator transcription factor [Clostridium felsineum]|uniref:response regulator transcription factor n=1 Tax=Clostridium felsineum TaxID=36839 RepID=UPI00214DC7AF|nr:response regulator transcription factor [Clostridium felsineum]MCR3759024.1 response regulator transcription factor [Clostridium felsineum]
MKILLAEDEKELSNALVAILKFNKYSVDAVYDGAEAFEHAFSESYDALVLDIMMPKMSGIEVLEQLREKGICTPVLMLTAKAEIEDRILGLDKGADDYLGKPFAMGELLARLRAMTRRKSEFTPNLIKVGNISLNKENYEISNEKSSLILGNKEFQMLQMLMNNTKRSISVKQFMERVWEKDSEAEINVVWVYISYLRKKLEALEANIKIKEVDSGYILEI